MIGTRIGPYEIRAALGAGGMGEVYRARDTTLGRDVALKVLPQDFSQDADRLARFRREAQVLASLNHSHIAAIHGLEELGGVPVLVLELVEGPTLADRIATGAIPADEAFSIAGQIAEALAAAHERAIVHRDLKPANIKLRPDGVVKVLDFGLAKALEPLPATDPSVSPTMTSPAMTRMGVIVGTASYMSPEQARGHVVDRGADIWAWGCVLFEMLTGTRAFGGADTTDVIAAVVRGDPDWSRLPEDTPPSVHRLVRRCLEKDPRRRLADIRDARFALEDASQDRSHATVAPKSGNRERLAWVAALLVCLAVLLWRAMDDSAPPAPQVHAEITTPPTTDLVSLALSPSGERLAFVASFEGRPMLWLRSLGTGESLPLRGTDGASFPFWSPDSRSIGFFANDRVYRIGVDGGSLKELASVPVAAGGTWSRDGVILFPPVPDGPISRVREDGGQVDALPTDQKGPGGNRFPQFLPDGRRYLYYMAEAAIRGVYVGTLDGPERRRLFDADAAAVVVRPAEIMFVRGGTLYVQRFDPNTLALQGEAVAIARGIAVDASGAIAASASDVGSIVYRAGSGNRRRQLAWFDRSGSQIGEAFPPDSESSLNPALSPDGRTVAMNRVVGGNADVWLQDLTRKGAPSRLTVESTPDIYPIWSPDGRRIAYGGTGKENFSIFVMSTIGGERSLLHDGPLSDIPMDWSRDGRFLLYRAQSPAVRHQLWALPLTGSQTPFPVTPPSDAADARTGQFSPDGKWVAYESNASGRYEIYVQAFPKAGVKAMVSTTGGLQPRWNPDSKEIFYVAPDARLTSVSLRFGEDARSIEPASPVSLFPTRINGFPSGGSVVEYDVSGDGRRFLMNTLVEQTAASITLILNRAR